MRRYALVHITLHTRQHLGQEGIRIIFRPHDALERVATDAIEQLTFLLVGTGNACQPFAVRQLRGEIFGLTQLEIDCCRLLFCDLDCLVGVEVIADRAHSQGILTRCQFTGREGKASTLVGHHRYRDGRSRFAGADQHSFHRVIFGGADKACQSGGRRLCEGNARNQKRERQTDGNDKCTATHDLLPDDDIVLLVTRKDRPRGRHPATGGLRPPNVRP